MWIFLIIHLLTKNVALFAYENDGAVEGAPIVNENEEDEEVNVVGYATLGQFPFFATLFLDGYFRCGGCIISTNYILTAGHCIFNFTASQIQAVIGIVEIKPNSTGFLHNATKLILHPNYNNETLAFDIGLIEVGDPMKLNTSNVDSIQLTDKVGNYLSNITATVVGYALNITAQDENDKLKYGHMSMYTEDECNAAISPDIFNHSICAANYLAKVSICSGDSGGPLIIDHKLFGIVSSYYTCGTNIPAVFTRVNSFRSWIINNSQMKPPARGSHWKLVNGTLTVD
ncbi:trypsin-3-like [Cochliomyia hominivorax]